MTSISIPSSIRGPNSAHHHGSVPLTWGMMYMRNGGAFPTPLFLKLFRLFDNFLILSALFLFFFFSSQRSSIPLLSTVPSSVLSPHSWHPLPGRWTGPPQMTSDVLCPNHETKQNGQDFWRAPRSKRLFVPCSSERHPEMSIGLYQVPCSPSSSIPIRASLEHGCFSIRMSSKLDVVVTWMESFQNVCGSWVLDHHGETTPGTCPRPGRWWHIATTCRPVLAHRCLGSWDIRPVV